MKEIHYFYKITNLINKKFYYGIRTCRCLPGKDPYMGSGVYLHRAYKKYGIKNFKKEILRVCRTREDVSDLETWIVTEELVKNPMCYNLRVGGDKDSFYGKVSCRDKLTGKICHVSKSEFYSDSDRYEGINKNLVLVRHVDDHDKKHFLISSKEYHSNKSLYSSILGENGVKGKGKLTVKDEFGNTFKVDKEDDKYKSGELVPLWKGWHHSQETKEKISKANKVSLAGCRNPKFGKTTVNNGVINKCIPSDELNEFLMNNHEWKKGTLFSEEGLFNLHRRSRSLAIIHHFNELNKLVGILRNLPEPKQYNYTNGIRNIRIKEIDISYYEERGYWRGITQFNGHRNHNPNSGCKGFKWINNGIENKYCNPNEIESHLSNGWKLGKLKKAG